MSLIGIWVGAQVRVMSCSIGRVTAVLGDLADEPVAWRVRLTWPVEHAGRAVVVTRVDEVLS